MAKKIWEMTVEEKAMLARDATQSAIAHSHALGLPTTHGDQKGVYLLYPDGHKEYVKEYKAKEKAQCRNLA